MKTLTLFHGSNQAFDAVDLSKSRARRDFGHGFYTTTLRQQAEDWAVTVQKRHGGDAAYLYEYSFDWADTLKAKIFQGLDLEWLEFIKECRLSEDFKHDYDIVIGPVANDRTFQTLTLYLEGIYPAEFAIEQLKMFRPNNQLSIHTPAAVEKLVLKERTVVGK